MITIHIADTGALHLAMKALQELREQAWMMRAFRQPHTRRSSPAAYGASCRLAHQRAREYRPLLQAVVRIYGAQLFRRHTP